MRLGVGSRWMSRGLKEGCIPTPVCASNGNDLCKASQNSSVLSLRPRAHSHGSEGWLMLVSGAKVVHADAGGCWLWPQSLAAFEITIVSSILLRVALGTARRRSKAFSALRHAVRRLLCLPSFDARMDSNFMTFERSCSAARPRAKKQHSTAATGGRKSLSQ